MFKGFWEQNKLAINFAGSITAIGGLFLNIPIPTQEPAKHYLANVQVFWLLLFTISLVYFSVSFIKFVFQSEKKLQGKYDIPTLGVFSISMAGVLLWVAASLLGYISALYSTSFAELLGMTFPAIVLVLCVLVLIFIEKRKKNISYFWTILANSLILSVLACVSEIYIQQGLLKRFYTYWFYPVLPLTFFGLSFIFIIVAKVRNKTLFEK